MTKKQLIKRLSHYPDDATVWVCLDSQFRRLSVVELDEANEINLIGE